MQGCKLFSAASACALVALLSAGAARAQAGQAPDAPPTPQVNENEVDQIIVTAQRRAENIQNVPLSITATTGEGLRDKGIYNLQDLRYIDPSLNYRVSTSAGSSAFAVRGVGTATYSAGLEQSVSTLIDGVILNDPSAAQILADIDRVEVLRGPQGMLFGKNASAGVISITTADPRFNEFTGITHLTFGENNERILQAIANIPISDTLAARVVLSHNHYDSWVNYVLFPDSNPSPIDINGIRAKLRWRPNDKLNAVLSFDANYTGDFCCLQVARYTPAARSPVALSNAKYGVVASPDNFDVAGDKLPTGNGRIWGASLNVDYKLPAGFTLNSITGYRQSVRSNYYDADYADFPYVDTNGGTAKNANFSQELRITSPLYDRFDYVAGLYYFRSRVNQGITQIGTFATPPFGSSTIAASALNTIYGGTNSAYVSSQDVAVFGQMHFRITDTLSLIAGARYTRDDLSLQYISAPASTAYLQRPTTPYYVGYPGPYPTNIACITKDVALARGNPALENCFPAFKQTTDADNISWRATVQNQFTRDIMAYFTAARGYKGPGFSALSLSPALLRISTAAADQRVRPEIPMTYEVGLKSSFFGRRVVFNADYFHTDYKDFQQQVSTSTPAGFVTIAQNAGSLDISGEELSLVYKATPDLSFSAAATFLDAHYGDFVGVPCYVMLTNASTGATTTQPGCNAAAGNTINAKGNRLAGAPDLQYNLAAAYDRPNLFRNMSGHARVNWAWQDDVIYQPNGDPLSRQPSFGLLGGEIGVGAADDRWRVSVYATNLLDQHWAAAISAAPTQAINPGGTIQYLSDQSVRHVGVRIDARF